jgi:cardiolipin synthase
VDLLSFITQPWVYRTLMATYALSIVTVIVVIIGENRNPVKSLAWVTVLILLPAVGLVLYVFFGRNIKNKRMISRRNKRKLKRKERFHCPPSAINALSDEARQMTSMAHALTGVPYYPDNHIRLFNSGADKFQALKQDLRHATRFIHLQYYIFEDDKIGHEISDILIERAQAGVAVRVIYDHVGSFHVRGGFFKRMRRAGVQIHPFFKVNFIPFASKINWRNHRKLVIIDGEIGYIGGMNIADRYIDGGKQFRMWRDCHLRIQGPAVGGLQHSFAVDWNFMGMPLLDETCDAPRHTDPATSAGAQVITSGPMGVWDSIAHVFLRAIGTAKRRIFVQTPYFLPTEALLKALQNAALSGVDVRIMLPKRSDSRILNQASRSYLTECMQAGVKLYFFTPGMLHSKVLLIDDDFATVGSTNFDFRSFEHNFEANLLIYSRHVNAQLAEMFVADLKQSVRVKPAEWRRRPLLLRFEQSLLRLLSPIL